MDYIVVDLEATCWEKGTQPGRQEIIEIGAVRIDGASGESESEFLTFVRPVNNPILSEFCTNLTSIRTEDVVTAPDFPDALASFLSWIGPPPVTMGSWGAYDMLQFGVDCRRHGVPWPEVFDRHINLKKAFAERRGIKPCGMRAALRILGIPLQGTHHRAIDDARNIVKIVRVMLPQHLEEGGRGPQPKGPGRQCR